MVSLADIIGIISSVGTSYIGIGAVIVIGVILFFLIRGGYVRRRAEEGTWKARRMVSREGFGYFSRGIRNFISRQKGNRSEADVIDSKEASRASQEKSKGDPSGAGVIEAAAQDAEAVSSEMAAGVATSAVIGRTLEVEASLKEIIRAVLDFGYKIEGNILLQEKGSSYLESLENEVGKMFNFDRIDVSTSAYLSRFTIMLNSFLQKSLQQIMENEQMRGFLVTTMKGALDVMKKSIRDAIYELNRLRRSERKTKKRIGKELKYLQKSLNGKIKELKALNKKGAEQSIVQSLESEIKMRQTQINNVRMLIQRLKATFKFMKKEIAQMKRLLRYVLANEKSLERYDSMLENRDVEVNKKLKELKENVSSIGAIQKFERANPHQYALVLSSNLKAYFNNYKGIIEIDIAFDKTVKEVGLKNIVIGQQMDAYDKLMNALIDSEKAVDAGISAVTQLLEGILGSTSRDDIQKISDELVDETKVLDYEQKINAYMSGMAQTLQRKSAQINNETNKVLLRDQELFGRIRAEEVANSEHIGKVMLTAESRKIAINNEYIPKAVKFGEALEKRDADAAAAYNQGMRAAQLVQAA